MPTQTKIRIREFKGQAKILVLINHPMESGLRRNEETGELVPAHYIETMEFRLKGEPAARVWLGPGVSRDPLTGVVLAGAHHADTVTVSWVDNLGQGETVEATVP